MRKKILPVHQPIIQHIPANAFLLSVIGETEDEYAWIMNNFVNIRYNPNTYYDDFYRNDMWYNCYHITENRFTKEFADIVFGDPVKMLINLIDADYYIYFYFNTRYIENYMCDEDNVHNAMIYGYDLDEEKVYIADFFTDKSITFESCSIKSYCDAYNHQMDKPEYYSYVWNRAFKLKKGYVYTFDIDELIIKLRDYLESSDLGKSKYFSFDNNDVEDILYYEFKEGYEYVYGLEVYDEIRNALYNGHLWRRPLQLLHEHKKLMMKRLKFLSENGFLQQNEIELENKCNEMINEIALMKNIFLKNEMKGKPRVEIMETLGEKFFELKEMDREFTKLLINSINNK